MTWLQQHREVNSSPSTAGVSRTACKERELLRGCTDEWEMEGERRDLVSLSSPFGPIPRKHTVLAMELTFHVLEFYTLCPQANCILTQYAFPELDRAVPWAAPPDPDVLNCSLLWANAHLWKKPHPLSPKPHSEVSVMNSFLKNMFTCIIWAFKLRNPLL